MLLLAISSFSFRSNSENISQNKLTDKLKYELSPLASGKVLHRPDLSMFLV